ncbi:hypothetical protein J7426_13520 [Tropicibacter sp. R16_0]|uniref:hypothetical protein n=1 Tax=Tropicibacter sp. R16_0 TaxID=2821102 RepID=UPI001ADCFAD0|nr:hypothetical protein [Tropicibacter sp. R16_0]MBO9451285.1 hypothetical protein [Tropicibacter sp. R16_0]
MATRQDQVTTRSLTQADVRQMLENGAPNILVVETDLLTTVKLPEGAVVEYPVLIDGNLILVQPEGTLIVFPNATDTSLLVDTGTAFVPFSRLLNVATPESEWTTLGDVSRVPLHFILSPGTPLQGSADDLKLIVEDPLIGLEVNPLLPPTDYAFGDRFERHYGGDDDNGSSPADLIIVLKGPLITSETDGVTVIRPADQIVIVTNPPASPASVSEIRIEISGLPAGATSSLGNLIAQPDGTNTLAFVGAEAEFQTLTLSFPTDFSTDSRSDIANGPLAGTIEVVASTGATETLDFPIRVTPEGDVAIDDSLPDLVPDETDAPTPVVPSELLLPAVTDADGSEALEELVLTIAGLPGGSDLASLGITLPAGATSSIGDDAATGAATLVITLRAADVGDVLAAYQGLNLSLPADFSTANRSDLTGGATTLPLTLTVDVQTDEDQDPATDTPTDGTATATRIVEIGATEDITLSAPRLRLASEDDGVPNSSQGVDVDLGIEIAITDQDGSETEDPSDPRFAATVEVLFAGLPAAATANGGTLDAGAGRWTGTVAQAEALVLSLPGDYNGTILSTITVTTPEGVESVPQAIVVTPVPDIVIDGTILTAETDAPVDVLLSAFISVLVSDPDETVESLSLSLPGLPPGMGVAGDGGLGTFTDAGNGTFTFDLTLPAGSGVDPAGVRLIFPTDYSTTNPAVMLEAALSVTTSDGTTTGDIPVVITEEGDVALADATLSLAETDAPVLFTPAASLVPQVTDADGSESIALVAVVFNALPPGTRVSTDGGVSFAPLTDPALNFIGTLAEYQNLVLSLPTDYSTQNPATTLYAEVAAVSDEGGFGLARLDVVVSYELDVTLAAPGALAAVEDGDGVDGGGVTVDLQITAQATDRDGSEDSTRVEIAFTDLPPGAVVNGGTLDAGTGLWTGTMAQAEALTLHLPGDYSGTISSVITALSPEGTVNTTQVLTVAPAGDIDFDIDELVAAETDARVVVTPSSAWAVSVSDSDPGLPAEALETVVLSLADLPPNVQVLGVPAGTISYNPAAGGPLTFTGTEAQYLALQLSFPADYSTTSPAADGLVLSGTLTATSTEDAGGQSAPVTLRITPEGDVAIDDSLPDLVPDETDAPTPVVPSELLLPAVTDADGSEALEELVLTIAGLPGGSDLASLGITLPAGATSSIGDDAATGAATLVITLRAADVGDVLAAYQGLNLSLPADFSTANRSDLTGGATTLPLTLTVDVQTDEDQDPATDTPTDGTATATRIVEIGFELDVTLDAPATLTRAEDSSGVGVTLDLGIQVAATDIDGSEDSTTVEIQFTGLPDGSTFSVGQFDPATGIWTGNMVAANALNLTLPEDYSGTIQSQIKALSPEGTVSIDQIIEITPTGDIVLDVEELRAQETDARTVVTPSAAWQVSVDDNDGNMPIEVIETISVALADLPPNVLVLNVPASTYFYNPATGGGLTFTGTEAQYQALQLSFPTDYSTESPAADGLVLDGTLSATSTEDASGTSTPITLRITPEGDVEIDDSLPDTVPDETDASTLIRPSDLLLPAATDLDGSEALETLTLVINGLPAGSDETSLMITVPTGATLNFATDAATGASTLTLTMDVANVGDVAAAYAAFNLTLPADFSTANRSDLTDGSTTLPLTFTLDVQTDEDQDPATDTPTDGTATATRVVEIGFEEDIDLAAPAVLITQEDGGVIGNPGVDLDLEIQIDITDQDGSETADPTDPRFAAEVQIIFVALPQGTGVNGGTLTNNVWNGTVADAEALVLSLPGDYFGTFFHLITVVTPEGDESTLQAVVVEPTTDTIIEGEVNVDETDDVLPVKLDDFYSILIDPTETIFAATFEIDNLPLGTEVLDLGMNPVGTITDNGDGTVNFVYLFPADGVPPPPEVTVYLPKDYSTTSPAQTLTADVSVTTDQGTETAALPFIVNEEGDVVVDDGSFDLAETDSVVRFRLADEIMPMATDMDASESIETVAVVFNALPSGARFSTDGGATFQPATSTLDFVGTLAQYNSLIIELPADYSTENPATTLQGAVGALTDEGGFDAGNFSVSLTAEGDLAVTGSGRLDLVENDAPGDLDEDNTTDAPIDARLVDAISATSPDADGSESIATVDVTVSGLPDGTQYSTDGGTTFMAVPAGPTFVLNGLTDAEYKGLILRLPNDFSTTTDITGSATFTTDEAILAGETDVDGTDGIETRGFVITVASEQDVVIAAQDITVIEDLGSFIPFNLDAAVTDIDGSENITAITVDFTGLPTGDTVLTGGVIVNGPTDSWTGTLAELQALGVVSFPQHFSGIVGVTVTVQTDEGIAAGTSESFDLNVTPVAEPTLVISVDDSPASVDRIAEGNYLVDEDSSFLMTFDAQTPDRDGSEQLTTIVVDNVPAGWVPNTNGNVDLSLFEQGAAQVASATVSSTTLTITLNSGVQEFMGALRVTPLADDDRDAATIVGDDLVATVTSVDTAAGLPSDTQTAQDDLDIDVDAIVDPLDFTVANSRTNENTGGSKRVNIELSNIALQDNDGSEVLQSLALSIAVATESDNFDPSDTNDLLLEVSNKGLASKVQITQAGSTLTSVDYTITPLPTTSAQEFADALDSMRIVVPQHFSGVLTLDGTLAWNETTTGDVEVDTSDNFATSGFQIIQTVRPRAEAELTASVFVRRPAEVADDSPQIVSATIKDGSVSGDEILTLLESTADGSGPGQVDLYVGLDASTPDTDGSEQIETILITNVPTDWIADHLSGTTVLQSAFFQPDGGLPLAQTTYDLIDSATYNQATGDLTISFVPNVTSFEASLQLRPSLYEDYDVDRQNGDPFSSVGDFFGDDLNIEVSVSDDNTNEVRNAQADATFDVDVDPVNNIAVILTLPQGNEMVIDDAGGVWQIPFQPVIQDNDGSESVTAVVMREVPNGVTVYIQDPNDPTGPKIPALLTDVNVPPGFNSWSLENDSWLTAELRGIPTHYAGDYPLKIDVVTTESDGGNTRVTTLDEVLRVDPVIDGGDPSESFSGREDTALATPIDGNIIDNMNNSPGSPEAILGQVVITNVVPDSFGRVPTFFLGPPQADPVIPDRYFNALPVDANGELRLTPTQAAELWILPGKDSNETIEFDVSVIYYETIDLSQFQLATGTVTVNVTGIADDPILELQNPDPTDDPNSGITDDQIDDAYRPTEIVDGIPNADRVYGYAGKDNAAFTLDSRIRDIFLQTGPISPDNLFRPADPIEGRMTEITFAGGQFDGSETLYYLITDVDPAVSFLGGTPVDSSGESYVVTADQLATLEFVPTNVTEVTYYDMTIHAIVVEDDQPLDGLIGTPEEVLMLIDSLPGGSVVPMDFTVVVVPATGGGTDPCEPEQELPLPMLELIGSGDEDTVIELTLKITPQPPFYDSIDDLVNLPNGVTGDFGIGIELPPGSSLATDPPGGALFDPVTGFWVIDLSVLGVDPSDPTQTEGKLLFTPPPHESSPTNPFDPADTFGPDDPYDELNSLNYSMILNNFTCGTSDSASSTFSLTINPVVDPPVIRLTGGRSFDEDTVFDLGLSITSPDGGERPGDTVQIELETSSGAQLLDENGNPLTGTDIGGGLTRFDVDFDDIDNLGLKAAEHYSGPLNIRITASSEDINGDTASSTLTQTLQVIPVADDPFFNFDNTILDPDTGQPFVDESGPVPVITAIEDIPLNLSQFIEANTPDQDGSETITIVLAGVPDYLNVTGPSNNGFIDNGDGSYTISESAFPLVAVELVNQHARTPDSLDPTLPSEIPLTLTVNTLELANSDQATGTQNFILRVRPDADTPTLTASINPTTGVEDSGDLFTLTLSGETPDPHETMSFEIVVPAGGKIFVDGVEQPVVGGVVTLGGTPSPTVNPSINLGFAPDGVVTFLAPPDFGGMTSLDVTAITTDADGIFTDTERTPTQSLDLDIAVAPDLVFSVLDPDVELDETDAVVTHDPAGDFDIQVTDVDGSEVVDNVTYTITGVPDGMAYQVGSNPIVPVTTADLTFTGSLADFQQLTLIFPQDYATNGTSLNGTINVTTNEGGDESGAFTIDVDGELDLSVMVDVQPNTAPQTGAPIVVDFGIMATVTDVQAVPSETLEEVVIDFTDPLPPGTTSSAGTISGDRLTLTRGATSPADFAVLVAALSITVPGTYAGVLEGEITVSTNHGSGAPEAFQVAINDQPDVSGPVNISSTDPSFAISFTDLLANSTDPDQPLTVENITCSDPLVGLNVVGSTVFVTVPDAYVGMPTLTYDVVDSGPGPARSTATANLDIDTLQMEPNGTHTGPDGLTRDLMDNVTGAVGGSDIARGTGGDDAVILDLTNPYVDIEGFELQGGSDFVDLSNSTRDFRIDLGAGDDWGRGGNGDDVLIGGAGADTLEGGGGTDIFTITDLGSADVILDFEEPVGILFPVGVDQIDLTSVVALSLGENLADHVGYDNSNGALTVDGSLAATVNADGGGFANEVEVIFTNASGAQETAII